MVAGCRVAKHKAQMSASSEHEFESRVPESFLDRYLGALRA